MARYRMVTRRLTFMGRRSPGRCKCPCCGTYAKVLDYPEGELWTALLCARCGWYQVPTMNAPSTTEFEVVVRELQEVKRSAKK